LAARYRDPSRDVGNLEPGATLFRPEPVESFPFCPYSADQIIAAHRLRNASRVPPPPRAGSFRHPRRIPT
jgi:hypothetical protein